jgi:hypothetical protein
MRNEHHDEANMGHNQSIDMKPLSPFEPRPYEQ